MKKKYDTGVIHGRFQIFHNDHMKYILSGQELCSHLVIGITNPDPMHTKDEKEDLKRSAPAANPLTYLERYTIIRNALIAAGIIETEYSIVPFPINFPEMYKYYVPMDAVFFLSIYDDWGRKKLETFSSLGLSVHILRDVPPEEKGISSTEIREKILKGEEWVHLVPETAAKLLIEWKVPDRVKELYK